jgi:hypothetical protein
MLIFGMCLIVTLLAVILAYVISVTGKLKSMQNRLHKPNVSFCFEIDPLKNVIYAVLRNPGSARADDVDVRISPPFKSRAATESGNNSTMSYLRVCSLTPGQELRYLVDSLSLRYPGPDTSHDDTYEVSLCYKDGEIKIEDVYKTGITIIDNVASIDLDKERKLRIETLDTLKSIVPHICNNIEEQGSILTQTLLNLSDKNIQVQEDNLKEIKVVMANLLTTTDKIIQAVESIDNSLGELTES